MTSIRQPHTTDILAAKILARMLRPQEPSLSAHALALEIFSKIAFDPLQFEPCSITDGRGINSREGKIGGMPVCRIAEGISLWLAEDVWAATAVVGRESLSIDISKDLIAAVEHAYNWFYKTELTAVSAEASGQAATVLKWLTKIIEAHSFDLMRVNVSEPDDGRWNISDLSKMDVGVLFGIACASDLVRCDPAYRTHLVYFSHEGNRGRAPAEWRSAFISASILVVCGVACVEFRASLGASTSTSGRLEAGILTHVNHGSVDQVKKMLADCDGFLSTPYSPFVGDRDHFLHLSSRKIIDKAVMLAGADDFGSEDGSRRSLFFPSTDEGWRRS